jgi:hypothetical protein
LERNHAVDAGRPCARHFLGTAAFFHRSRQVLPQLRLSSKNVISPACNPFYYTAVHKAAVSAAPAGKSRMVAWISLGLWALVPFGGIFLGFTDSTLHIK